jgi:arginyl-tRNA synthetase
VFANLASQRDKDVDFALEEVTSFEGDAGPYLQYAHARTAGILRKGGVDAASALAAAEPSALARDEEWALARLLSDFADECQRALEACEPHVVARYLLDVCAAFSRWYTLGNQDPALKVLAPDATTRAARLALTAATQRTLARGLGLLGLVAPETM